MHITATTETCMSATLFRVILEARRLKHQTREQLSCIGCVLVARQQAVCPRSAENRELSSRCRENGCQQGFTLPWERG
jgi:hypothetical protein